MHTLGCMLRTERWPDKLQWSKISREKWSVLKANSKKASVVALLPNFVQWRKNSDQTDNGHSQNSLVESTPKLSRPPNLIGQTLFFLKHLASGKLTKLR